MAMYNEILRQNIQWHKTEAYYYESTHPENYNIFEQGRLKRQIKAYVKGINSRLPVLDLGSGTGHLVRHMRHCGIEPVACDLSIDMLRENPAKNRVVCDATRLPFRSGSFGGIVSYSVFHHFPSPVAVMREVIRVANNESVLLFDHDPFIPHSTHRIGRYGFTGKDLIGWGLWLIWHPKQLWRLLHYLMVGRMMHLANISELRESEDEGRVNKMELLVVLHQAGFNTSVESYGKNSSLKAWRVV